MPLVRMSFKQDRPQAFRRSAGAAVHRALMSVGVPAQDRFQVLSSHGEDLVYDPSFLGVERTDGIVIVQIFLSRGRTVAIKQALYKAIAENLQQDLQIRPEDVFVSLIEAGLEDWSFGNGLAQYVENPPAHLVRKAEAS
jgi:4-oxalocrotonate tautomerase